MNNLPLRVFSIFTLVCFLFATVTTPALSARNYSYDDNGNLVSDVKNCYEYNEANKLTKVKKCANNQTIAEYVYDYEGNRIVKKEFENGQLKKTIYSPDDEFEKVILASNSAQQNTTYYKANDEFIAQKNPDGSKYYHHNDHLGSSSVLTDQSGASVEETEYDPWGEVKEGGTKSKFQYTGQEKDAETGLNYYNFRYYDSHTRRFAQPDDMLPDLYNPQDLNRYSYVNNNPIRYTDPSGHCIWDVCMVEATIAVSLYSAALARSPDLTSDSIALGDSVNSFNNSPSIGNGIGVALVAGSVAVPGLSAMQVKSGSNIAKAVFSGKYGEKQLSKEVSGSPKSFNTPFGRRDIDILDARKIANEAKSGYQTLTPRLDKQIQKDAALLASGQVNGVAWHFFKSPVTGKSGPSKQLNERLTKAGFLVKTPKKMRKK
jgi:RHS repeat-associated protein